MPVSRVHRHTLALTAILTILSLGGVQAALGETTVFKDIRRPGGIERSHAQKMADGRICGANATDEYENVPAFEKCMRAHGWAPTYIKPSAEERATGGSYFDDMRAAASGHPRGEAAVQADTHACNSSGRLTDASPRFRQCMTNHGWRLAFSLPMPHQRTYARGSSSSGPSYSAPSIDTSSDDAARALQDSINTMNAANAATAAAQAEAQTQQNNIISQTCNYQC